MLPIRMIFFALAGRFGCSFFFILRYAVHFFFYIPVSRCSLSLSLTLGITLGLGFSFSIMMTTFSFFTCDGAKGNAMCSK